MTCENRGLNGTSIERTCSGVSEVEVMDGKRIMDANDGTNASSKSTSSHVSFYNNYKVVYLGYAVLDRRYTLPMLPWIIAEVKHRGIQNAEEVTLELNELSLRVLNVGTKTLVFEHRLQTISKFAQTAQDPTYFTYMTREVKNGPCAYHVLQAHDECTVLEIFTSLREMTKQLNQSRSVPSLVKSSSSTSINSALKCGTHYEVLYLGRIRVTSKRAPPTFIDDAVDRFRLYELERRHSQNSLIFSTRNRHGSGTSICSAPSVLDIAESDKENDMDCSASSNVDSCNGESLKIPSETVNNISNVKRGSCDSIESFHILSPISPSHSQRNSISSLSFRNGQENDSLKGSSLKYTLVPPSQLVTQNTDSVSCTDIDDMSFASVQRARSCSSDIPRDTMQASLTTFRARGGSGGSSDMRRPRAFTNPSGTDYQQYSHTVIFLIGRNDVCLLDTDKKQVLLSKTFNDIAHCSQGLNHTDHFGFICRETTVAGADCYIGYVFRCRTANFVNEIMNSLKHAFTKAHEDYTHNTQPKSSNVPRVVICEACPMQWFHKLCCDVEGLPPENIHCTILLKLHTLPDVDREEIMLKCQSIDVNSLQEQNEVLMMFLRKFCERTQSRHNHLGAIARNDEKNSVSRLDTFRQKAKKSLSSSFETLLKLKNRDDARVRSLTSISDHAISALSDDQDSNTAVNPAYREGSYDGSTTADSGRVSPIRPRSSTFSTTHEVRKASKKRAAEKKNTSPQSKSPIMNIFMKVNDRTPPTSGDEGESPSKKGSWRQAIFHRVQTPIQTSKQIERGKQSGKNNCSNNSSTKTPTKKTRAQLRALWKKAIMEQILLIRMERENRKLQVSQDAATHKRMKLDYEDVTLCLKDAALQWDDLLNSPERQQTHVQKSTLQELVRNGVPRNKRGEIWQYLAEQYNFWGQHIPSSHESALLIPYEELLGQLTSHQHAILIDLGRTFPSHPFYSQPLGPGQLSLFNLLKSYSLLDKEVGYCQGLSFVAGILLLHMSEEQAFSMMKHILFNLGLRRQYRPDMVALQVQMYQLSRLVHDNYREVYDHLERYDIAPTLYAAPWFLTLFASQFPLGFVSRLFDLIFLQGLDAIFKMALVLIGNHKDLILQCHGFEPIMEFLKTALPSINVIEMQKAFNQVFTLDISKQLHAYEVEYHVLREEMIYSPSRSDTELVQKLETANRNLKVQNMELMEQLQVAYSSIHSLEAAEASYKSTVQRLESRVKALEEEKEVLLNSLVIMKKRLHKLEMMACVDSNNPDAEVFSENHPPSFQVVYTLAGSEKEEEQQLKQLIHNMCEEHSNEGRHVMNMQENLGNEYRENGSTSDDVFEEKLVIKGAAERCTKDIDGNFVNLKNVLNSNFEKSLILGSYKPDQHQVIVETERSNEKLRHNL